MKFPPSQGEYNAWFEVKLARAYDPDDSYHMVDVMDCNNVFALAMFLVQSRPELREPLSRLAWDAIEAADQNGTFQGAEVLCQSVGMAPGEGQRLMMDIIR